MSIQTNGIAQGLASMANVGQLFGTQDPFQIKNSLQKIQGQLAPDVFSKFVGNLGRAFEAPGHLPAPSEPIGRRVEAGDRYFFQAGQRTKKGRITERRYAGSFHRPILLRGGKVLYNGILYPSMEAIARDARDGRIDGQSGRGRPVGLDIGKMLEAIISLMRDVQAQGGCNGSPSPSPAPGCGEGTGSDAADAASGGSNVDLETQFSQALESGSIEDLVLIMMALLGKTLDEEIKEYAKGIKAELDKKAAPDGESGSQYRDESNLQFLQTKLQSAMDRRKQLYEMTTNTLKTLHDSSSSIIRNLKI